MSEKIKNMANKLAQEVERTYGESHAISVRKIKKSLFDIINSVDLIEARKAYYSDAPKEVPPAQVSQKKKD